MKRTLSVLAISMIVLLSLAAKAQSGATTGTITDNSLIFKGYYQGSTQPSGGGQGSEDKSISLTFYNKDGQDINHDHQGGSTGTKVQAGTSHQDSNTDTIFTWTMEGKTASEVTLRFTFSTMQAQVNGKYFRPTYTITMLQNPTLINAKVTTTTTTYRRKKNNYSNWERYGSPQTSNSQAQENYGDDPFYSANSIVVGNGNPQFTGTKAGPSDTEFLEAYSNANYIGGLSDYAQEQTTQGEVTSSGNYYYRTDTTTSKTINSWTRSGTCTLNVSDYEKDKPGDYVYSCWVIAEVTVE